MDDEDQDGEEYNLLRSEAAKFAADLMARSKSRGGIGIGGLLAPPITLPPQEEVVSLAPPQIEALKPQTPKITFSLDDLQRHNEQRTGTAGSLSRPGSSPMMGGFDMLTRINTPLASALAQTSAMFDMEVGDQLSNRSMSSISSTSSMTSILPFPFHQPPELPHVDAYVDKHQLLYREIKASMHFADETSIERKRKRLEKMARRAKREQDAKRATDEKEYEAARIYSQQQVHSAMDYFRSFSTKSSLTGKGEISCADLEASLRKHRRAVVLRDTEAYGHELLISLEWLLQESELTPQQWFHDIDTHYNTKSGGGKLNNFQLETGIDDLCDRLGVPRWKRDDIQVLLKHLDPNGDGDLSSSEIKLAFLHLHMPLQTQEIIDRAGPIITRLDEYMKTKQIRVSDLFSLIDTDKSELISMEELEAAIHSMFAPPPLTLSPSKSSVIKTSSPSPSVASSSIKTNSKSYKQQQQQQIQQHGKAVVLPPVSTASSIPLPGAASSPTMSQKKTMMKMMMVEKKKKKKQQQQLRKATTTLTPTATTIPSSPVAMAPDRLLSSDASARDILRGGRRGGSTIVSAGDAANLFSMMAMSAKGGLGSNFMAASSTKRILVPLDPKEQKIVDRYATLIENRIKLLDVTK